jgi:hypothetical protein
VHLPQVVSEVYSLQPVKVEPHVVLSLVLYKMVDANLEVREDAMHMLQVLSMREWHTSATDLASAAAGAAGQTRAAGQNIAGERVDPNVEGESGSVLVLGALQDSYQQFQYELAVSLARCGFVRGVLRRASGALRCGRPATGGTAPTGQHSLHGTARGRLVSHTELPSCPHGYYKHCAKIGVNTAQ